MDYIKNKSAFTEIAYIGYSAIEEIRFQATSGGIGTSVIKMLFEKELIQTSVTFYFDKIKSKYVPKLIYNFDEYNICGSIYHEIDLIGFFKHNISKIKGNFACFSLPCQARAIRSIIQKAGHECYIIGLTCSSQQTFEATSYLLRRSNISLIKKIQYRGNGWPSGIVIESEDNKKFFFDNNNSIWTKIFHSRLFIRPKCFKCQNTLNVFADITLADPWLKEYVCSEKIGQTIVIVNNHIGSNLIQNALSFGYVKLKTIPMDMVYKSQMGTIKRKESYKLNSCLVRKFYRLLQKPIFRKIVLSAPVFSSYCKFKEKFEAYLLNKNTK